MAELGFAGLGVMGGGIAKRLLDAGHGVHGWNRTTEKAKWLLDAGMEWAETPREAAERAEVVFTRALAARVSEVGASMLDAPVSGSVSTLEQGKLSIMVGGDSEAFERVRPVLEDIGPKVFHVGPNGTAVTMKIATNLSLAVQMLAFSEGVLLAEKSGIPRELAVEVMLASVIASPMVGYRGPFVLEQPDEAWFDVNMMQKDLNLALELGRELDVPLPTTAVTNEFLTAARALGLEEKDFAVLFDVLAAMAGVREEVAR
jgi:3-hydroxyisobutyrate dehydrogenase-like beta-hydroxyacid dehydrogenase